MAKLIYILIYDTKCPLYIRPETFGGNMIFSAPIQDQCLEVLVNINEYFFYNNFVRPSVGDTLRASTSFHKTIHLVVVVFVLTIVFSCIGIIFNYRMWRNVFGMSSMVWHPIDNIALDIRPEFPSEISHYNLTLAWVWQVSYFNPPKWTEPKS